MEIEVMLRMDVAGGADVTVGNVIRTNGTTEEVEIATALLDECTAVVDLLLSKRRDYGVANIAATGRQGLAVRILDKAARLVNLAQTTKDEIHHEGIDDTYTDLVGYGLIGLNRESPKGRQGW
jgi:hypothetical protein